MTKIRIAIAGVGNCASALVQGLEYYRNHQKRDLAGLMHPMIGEFGPTDVQVVAAFDIDRRKVGQPVEQAIFARPNCTKVFQKALPVTGVTVKMAPVMDGVPDLMADYPDNDAFRVADAAPVDVVAELKASKAEVLVCYLPVGSEEAVRFYADACIQAKVGMVNCVPVFIASDSKWAQRFRDAGVPIVGDDIKSQVGATIVHRTLTRLFGDRGVEVKRTYQLNTGGNTDFLNMLESTRLKSKKKSKTESVQSQLDQRLEDRNVHIGPSDYVPWQNDNKVAFIRMEGLGFGDLPMELEMRLSVEDSPNSAGVVIDAIRCAKLALDRKIGGPLEAPSSYYMKTPPKQVRDSIARTSCDDFIAGGSPDLPKIEAKAKPTETNAGNQVRSALLLAAGMGSRLFPHGSLPKPLTPVFGQTLAERVVRNLKDGAGISHFVVSLGYEADTVRSHFKSIASRNQVSVEFVYAADWEKGNGASALAAAELLGNDRFVLSMCDHLYDPSLVKVLVAAPIADNQMAVAVDTQKDAIPDLEDLTKVQMTQGAVTAIGKDLGQWDAGDAGVMWCNGTLFEGLNKAAAKGQHGLSDGLRVLAAEGRVLGVDITGHWWLDVDTQESLALAEKALAQPLRKIG